jgi:hypothetical protein
MQADFTCWADAWGKVIFLQGPGWVNSGKNHIKLKEYLGVPHSCLSHPYL